MPNPNSPIPTVTRVVVRIWLWKWSAKTINIGKLHAVTRRGFLVIIGKNVSVVVFHIFMRNTYCIYAVGKNSKNLISSSYWIVSVISVFKPVVLFGKINSSSIQTTYSRVRVVKPVLNDKSPATNNIRVIAGIVRPSRMPT